MTTEQVAFTANAERRKNNRNTAKLETDRFYRLIRVHWRVQWCKAVKKEFDGKQRERLAEELDISASSVYRTYRFLLLLYKQLGTEQLDRMTL